MNNDWLTIEREGQRVVLKKCSQEAEGKIIIPDGVTDIAKLAFSQCNKISEVHIPNSVIRIGALALTLAAYECPYQDELDRAHQRKSSTGDVLYADMLLGTWQCYYPMIIGGMEFKQIKFMSGGKTDITMAKQHDTEWYTETYNYAYYGNTLRFSRSGSNISFQIEGFLFPELYLRDSLGRYTMAKRSADSC